MTPPNPLPHKQPRQTPSESARNANAHNQFQGISFFGGSSRFRPGPSSRICPMIAQTSAQISSRSPNTVSANPPRAPGPVVAVQRLKDAPETGIAAFKPTVPWQYPKINPSPAASNSTDTIRGRSGFIRVTSLFSFKGHILPRTARILNLPTVAGLSQSPPPVTHITRSPS